MENRDRDDLEELSAAQTEWEKQGGLSSEGPLFQRAALDEIDRYETRYLNGDRFALMEAIYLCSWHKLMMPDWVSSEYTKGIQAILGCRAKSLDDVFGLPYKKGLHLNALRKKREIRPAIFVRVMEILKENPDTPIDRELFKRVGKEVRPPVGGSEAEKLWYEAKKEYGGWVSNGKLHLVSG